MYITVSNYGTVDGIYVVICVGHLVLTVYFRQKCTYRKVQILLIVLYLRTALRKKLTGSQLVKKFPAFYGTRGFITAFTSARHLSLS